MSSSEVGRPDTAPGRPGQSAQATGPASSEAGPVVAVIGAGSGIGRAVAVALAGATTRVVAADRDAATLESTAQALPGTGHLTVVVDLTDRDALTTMAAQVEQRYGRLDGLVVAAGIVATDPASTISPELTRRVFDVNVLGGLAAVQTHLDLLRRTPGDRSVVFLSSVAGSVGGGLLGGPIYAASKAAVDGLTRGLAKELTPAGIRVNAVAPGPVDTPLIAAQPASRTQGLGDLTLMGRMARPEEIAAVVTFLLGSASSYVTGHVLHANGGLYFG